MMSDMISYENSYFECTISMVFYLVVFLTGDSETVLGERASLIISFIHEKLYILKLFNDLNSLRKRQYSG